MEDAIDFSSRDELYEFLQTFDDGLLQAMENYTHIPNWQCRYLLSTIRCMEEGQKQFSLDDFDASFQTADEEMTFECVQETLADSDKIVATLSRFFTQFCPLEEKDILANEPSDDSLVHREARAHLDRMKILIKNLSMVVQHGLMVHLLQDTKDSSVLEIYNDRELKTQLTMINACWSDITKAQQFLFELLDANVRNRWFRRNREEIFKSDPDEFATNTDTGEVTIYNPRTHTKLCSIEDLPWQNASRSSDSYLWKLMTSGNAAEQLVKKYFSSSNDYDIVNLEIDRSCFRYENGIFDAKSMGFYLFGNPTHDINIRLGQKGVANAFYSDNQYFRDNPTNPCNFNPQWIGKQDFHSDTGMTYCTDLECWTQIDTPKFDTIFDLQTTHLSDEKKKDVYQVLIAFLFGRILFNAGEEDRWQVAPFLYGVAGAGKSSLCRAQQHVYQMQDTGVLSSNIEEKFGLGSLYEKKVIICPEVKKNFSLSLAELQSMISCERMSIARKHQSAIQAIWEAPITMAGNEVPMTWIDTGGQLVRRLLVFEFLNQPTAMDANLDDELLGEVPLLIVKGAIAYHSLKKTVNERGSSFWSAIPDYFIDQRRKLLARCSPAMSFFTDETRCKIASLEMNRVKSFGDHEMLPESISTEIRVLDPREAAATTLLKKLQPRGGSHTTVINTYLHGVYNKSSGDVDICLPHDEIPGKVVQSQGGNYNGMLSSFFTPLSDIKKAYKQYCSDEKMSVQPFDLNSMRGALNELKLVETDVVVQVKTEQGIVPKSTTVLFGIKLVQ